MDSRVPLLSIREIQAGLNREFQHLEPELSGYRLLEGNLQSRHLLDLERELSIKLPEDFRLLISEFDFGNLTIGPVSFGFSCDYTDMLLELNTTLRWWGPSARPESMIMVANSDPFAIMLDVGSGEVLAMDAELGYERATLIARDFASFFAGLGTTVLLRNQTENKKELAQRIANEIGSDDLEFWNFLMR